MATHHVAVVESRAPPWTSAERGYRPESGRTNARQREATRRLALLETLRPSRGISRTIQPRSHGSLRTSMSSMGYQPNREAMYWHLVERFGRDIAEQSPTWISGGERLSGAH